LVLVVAAHQPLDIEIGRSFLEKLRESQDVQRRLVKDIEDRLLWVIQAQHDAIQSPPGSTADPPQTVFDRQKQRLLASLKFDEMALRHERIPKAARDTFEWVYRAPESGEAWSSFVAWLQGDDGVYWITGKPGSGKSTLMKFLSDDIRTETNLRHWSQHRPLVCARFYFWNSGTEIQMSNEGLARSLLHQLCEKASGLIPEIFPDRWEALNLFGATHKPWTMAELLRALRTIATPAFSERRFFLLIDGLDEFDGDKGELVDLVKAMAACGHVKICVSSRPWIEFQEGFASRPSLRVEDLTLADIKVYVESKFNASPRFSEIRRRDPASADELCTAIADRSSGVFLWVHLVVKSLLQGISNGDEFLELRERLAELPSDLERLFQKILIRIEPRYQPHASRLFRIHHEHGSSSLLRFAFADLDEGCLRQDDQHVPLPMDEFLFKCEQMKNRIDSRTKGLLEVTKWKTVEKSQRYEPCPRSSRGLQERERVVNSSTVLTICLLERSKRFRLA
jgi:energy-coupling factor transporter ATP-binding protein EcfA2